MGVASNLHSVSHSFSWSRTLGVAPRWSISPFQLISPAPIHSSNEQCKTFGVNYRNPTIVNTACNAPMNTVLLVLLECRHAAPALFLQCETWRIKFKLLTPAVLSQMNLFQNLLLHSFTGLQLDILQLPFSFNMHILTLFHMNKISSYSAWSGSFKTPRYSLQHIYKTEKTGIPLTTWSCYDKYWHLSKTD